MTTRHHLTVELRWRASGRLDAKQISERLVSRSTVRRKHHGRGLYAKRPEISSRSRHEIVGNVYSGHVNGGLYFLRMSSGLASKAILDEFSFGQNLELVYIHDTYVKEMHMDQAVSVFRVVSPWENAQTSISFPVELLMLTPIEMAFWMFMCALMSGQQVMLSCYSVIMRNHDVLALFLLILSRKQFSVCSVQLDQRSLTLSSTFGMM
ncbi:hypothetical protein TNCV_3122321 [Trichonephila clavipes]|nr:hypothetical protein TNCV_3122321 [Trichonephila clavipes]